jgi:hypothetical protein
VELFQFRQIKIKNLHPAVLGDEYVLRLEAAVNDSFAILNQGRRGGDAFGEIGLMQLDLRGDSGSCSASTDAESIFCFDVF